jgi:hypothetical protein
MAKPFKAFTRSTTAAHPVEQKLKIAEQTAAFLSSGGTIQQIPRGFSGQPSLGGPSYPPRTETRTGDDKAPAKRS